MSTTRSPLNHPEQVLGSSELKQFADDNLKFDENGGKFSKMVKNTVGKGEIARYERLAKQTGKNKGLFGKELAGTCTCVWQ